MATQRTATYLALAATGFYVLWGLLHIGLGVSMSVSGLSEAGLTNELHAESTMYFISATVFGAMAIAIALTLNRANDPTGFWLNLGMGGTIDLAFIVILVLPGHVDLFGGLSGPAIWVIAASLSALALARQPQPIVNSRTASAPPSSRLPSLILPRSSPVASV